MRKLLLFIALLLATPVGLLAQGKTWDSPAQLPLGQDKSGSLSKDQTEQFWAFTVTQDGAATITVTPGSGLRIGDVRLYHYEYGANNELINWWQRTDHNYWFNPGWNSGNMTTPNLAPGTYLIRVQRGEGEGNYTIKCDFTANSYANNRETDDWDNANTLPLNSPVQGHLGYGYTKSDEDNYDWWTFTVTADGTANINIKHESTLRILDLRLCHFEYDEDDNIINYWQRTDHNYWVNPGWNAADLTTPNLAPGTYLVRIGRGEGQGGYELTCNFEPQEYRNDPEPNTNWTDGLSRNYLARGQEKQAHLGYGYTASSEDNYDFFRISVPRDGKVSIIYTPTGVNSHLRVSDLRLYHLEYGDGQVINYWQRTANTYWVSPGWNAATLTTPDMAPGNYLVRVERGEGYGAYTLKYVFEQNELPNDAEPNNEWTQAARLYEGVTQSGHLGYGYATGNEDSYDFYKVTMSKAGTLKINIQPGSGLRISDVRLYTYEYDANGTPINYWQRTKGNYWFNPGWNFGTMTTEGVEAGDYLIRVERGEGCGNYRIAFNAELTDVEPLEPLADEQTDDTDSYFVAWLNNGEKHYYALSEKPKVMMADGQFTLTTISTTVTYAVSTVQKFTLAVNEDTEGIKEIAAEPAKATMERHADRVVITGAKANSPVYVYGMGGRVVERLLTDANGRAEVSLEALAPGIYIVNTESVTIKIAKK